MLTISILNYHSWENTAQCIRDLCTACAEIPFRVLVLDNSITSELELLQNAIREISIPLQCSRPGTNTGFGRGHNENFLSVDHAPGDQFLILNPDVRIYDRQVIADMVRRCTPQQIVSCTIVSSASKGVWYAGGRFSRITGEVIIKHRRFEASESQTEIITGCCMMVNASLFKQLGGFDNIYFMYSEDVDLCLRARELGIRFTVLQREVVHFIGSCEKGRYSDLYLLEGTKNRIICIKRNRAGIVPLCLIYIVLKYGVVRSLQLLLFSKRPWKQTQITWQGINAGLHFREMIV